MYHPHTTGSSVAAPSDGKTEDQAGVPAPRKEMDLSEAIATITSTQQVYSAAKLPPALPVAYKRWVPEQSPDAPHDQHSYWPMLLYK